MPSTLVFTAAMLVSRVTCQGATTVIRCWLLIVTIPSPLVFATYSLTGLNGSIVRLWSSGREVLGSASKMLRPLTTPLCRTLVKPRSGTERRRSRVHVIRSNGHGLRRSLASLFYHIHLSTMSILPLSSSGRDAPTQHTQGAPYFSAQGGPTIGLPNQHDDGFGRRKSDSTSIFGFSSNSSSRIHSGGVHGRQHGLGFVPLFLRRLFRFPHMDFQVGRRGQKNERASRIGHLDRKCD